MSTGPMSGVVWLHAYTHIALLPRTHQVAGGGEIYTYSTQANKRQARTGNSPEYNVWTPVYTNSYISDPIGSNIHPVILLVHLPTT